MPFPRPQALQQSAPIGDDGVDGQALKTDDSGRLLTVTKIWDGIDEALVTAAGELSVNVGNAGDIGGVHAPEPDIVHGKDVRRHVNSRVS